jgi:hypothetical protein
MPDTNTYVNNAGLVLLNNYFPMLFERLGLLSEDAFKDAESQSKAINYLQYLVTGMQSKEEQYLVLNKVLSGLPMDSPSGKTIEIPEDQKILIQGLLEAVISHWSALGDSTIDGFRGNWLVRYGILREEEDKFELTVEKKPYDILIQQAPFSFSIIKFPWMTKPLHVSWNY